MGLDSVAIVLDAEDAFGIEIPDEAAGSMRTPRDLIDYVYDHVNREPEASCASLRAFAAVRNGLMESPSVHRDQVRLETHLDDLIPRAARRESWITVKSAAGTADWPSLIRPTWLVLTMTFLTATTAIGFGVWLNVTAAVSTLSGALIALILMFLGGIVLNWATRPFQTHFPVGQREVRGLVTYVAAKNPEIAAPDPDRWTRERVALVVRQIVADNLGVVDFDEGDRFVEDLGMN